MDLPPVVQVLLKPEIYPHLVERVQLKQTQMSFILLAGEYVYKLKKAVDLGYLDYTTLDRRRYFCFEEVRLNRRLCPQIYLGVVPISWRLGRFHLGGGGKVLEYAVRMKRLPQERMMEELLDRNGVSPEMIEGVAEKLACFHKRAQTSPQISSFGDSAAISFNWQENFSQTEKFIDLAISRAKYQNLKNYVENFLKEEQPLLEGRVNRGRIRDCHGDVHAAHICFADDIYIYDCIEFNNRFRYQDVASEVAFLAMDLDFHYQPGLAEHFVQSYIELSGDQELLKLLPFYKSYRAYVRGKVEGFKAKDPYLSPEEKHQALAHSRRYFNLSAHYIGEKMPLVVLICGLVGVGKSTLAHYLAPRLNAQVISSDVVRKRLAGVSLYEHRFEGYEGGIYSPEFTHKTYENMAQLAGDYLRQGKRVILEATFRRKENRLRIKKLAEELGAWFYVVELKLDEEILRSRLEQRLAQPSISDATWEIYQRQKAEFESIDEVPPSQHILVDASPPVEKAAQTICDTMGQAFL